MSARVHLVRIFRALFLAGFIPAAFASAAAGADPDRAGLETTYTAVVRRATGDVRVSAGVEGLTTEVKAGDVPESGRTFTTGADAFLELRFHPDMMIVEVQASSRVAVAFSRTDSGEGRRIQVREGRIAVRTGSTATAETILALEDKHSRARVRGGRVAFTTGAAATILVLEGEAEVLNLRTGVVDVVKGGGKAVAGQDGTVLSRAGEGELAAAGLRQNRLEVDFWNPATEEYRTLEIEYEGRPPKR